MMMHVSGKPGKVARRGERQIYRENRTVILHYSIGAIVSSAFYGLISSFYPPESHFGGFAFLICVALQFGAILTMRFMAKSIRNVKGQVIDAGFDLNQPDALGEYCKDVVILCSFVTITATAWSGFFGLLLLIPMYVLYKLWRTIFAPWFFAESPQQEDEEKKFKKRERKLRRM